ncbi:hypothetical protein TWF569_004759 [Orbilia oligospora]|nr:hypothetical protein TWF569_004759 [Orbilia oligospora]
MDALPVEPCAEEETFDLVIVGAGINGLLAAKAFLDIQPSIKIVVLDSLGSVGGVWAKERIYPGLNVQTTARFFEFPEFGYKDCEPPVEYNGAGFITGPSWSRYFEQWSDKVGLTKYIRLNTSVSQVTRHKDGLRWQCYIAGSQAILTTSKLIIANGISTLPKYPDLDFQKFTGPIMHHRYFGDREADWMKEEVKEVTVYGAGKGCMDDMVQLVKAGKKVKWVIRKEGRGPCWILGRNLPGGRTIDSVALSRITSIFLPSMYQDDDFQILHYFFKRNFIGKAISSFFLNFSKTIAMIPMKPLSNENLQKAIPDIAPFWLYHPIGIDNYDVNICDYLRNGDIEVIRDTIVSLEGNKVMLASNPSYATDAVIFGTGWKSSISLFSENRELEMQLGLPSASYTEEYIQKWRALETEADRKVFATNPVLRHAPKLPTTPPSTQELGPFRLYHHTIPTNFADRSIAFLGVAQTAGTIHYGLVMALWTAAYFNDRLNLPSKEEMERIAAYELRFNQIRHLGIRNEFPIIYSDFMSVLFADGLDDDYTSKGTRIEPMDENGMVSRDLSTK